MDWVLIYNRVMRFGMRYTEVLIPIQLALITAALVTAIITIIKDKQSRWLASSLAVMVAQLFLSMHFIRNYHIGVIHLIVALAASIGTRITGYISTITPPTFAFYVFDRRSGDSGMLPTIVSAKPLPFNERIAYLNTAPKIIGIILVAILFASLITLSLRIKRFAPKRNKLFVFPSLVLVIELIRYVTISICDLFFERLTDLRFGLINIIACIICLVWAVYLFKTRLKSPE